MARCEHGIEGAICEECRFRIEEYAKDLVENLKRAINENAPDFKIDDNAIEFARIVAEVAAHGLFAIVGIPYSRLPKLVAISATVVSEDEILRTAKQRN